MRIYAAQENIPRAIDFVEAELKSAGVPKEKIRKTSLSLEEVPVNLICKSNPDSEIDVTISKFMGRIRVKTKSVGLPLR